MKVKSMKTGRLTPKAKACTPTASHRTAPTREQWMIGRALAGVVQALNAAFVWNEEWGEQEAVNDDPGYEERVAEIVAARCDHMMIDDAIGVLGRAYELSTGKVD